MNGFNDEGFRILPLKFSGEEDYTVIMLPQFDQDELDCKSWEIAVKSLERIKNLEE